MPLPDWRKLVLDKSVLVEPVSEQGRIILWLRGDRSEGFQYWERVSTVPRTEVRVTEGIGFTPATSVPVRQRCRGLLKRLFGRWGRTAEEGSWVLPNGQTAQQCGTRDTDLLLTWAENEGTPLNESRVKTRWPQHTRLQQLGPNLFLIATTASDKTTTNPIPPPTHDDPPREVAERLLMAAREAGNRHAEASALTDLGILCMRQRDPEGASAFLEQALTLVRQLGDQAGEIDALGYLGQAALTLGEPQRALDLCEQGVVLARSSRNRVAEKSALERLALAYAGLGDHTQATTFYEQALYLAHMLGDRQHEAEMFWHLGIQHAEMGRRDQAITLAQTAVKLLEKMGKPQAAYLAGQLEKYRQGEATGRPLANPTATSGASFGGAIVVSAGQAGQAATGPNLLRMALAAAKSMAKFLGSGLKTVSAETHQERLRVCGTCEHYTGLRCRVCGCFTSAKAWMSHEDCPLGKWRD